MDPNLGNMNTSTMVTSMKAIHAKPERWSAIMKVLISYLDLTLQTRQIFLIPMSIAVLEVPLATPADIIITDTMVIVAKKLC